MELFYKGAIFVSNSYNQNAIKSNQNHIIFQKLFNL